MRDSGKEIEDVINPSEADDDLKIDVLAPCGEECCTHRDISSTEFLEGFTENLPAVGNLTLLRLHGSTLPGFLLRRCGNEH